MAIDSPSFSFLKIRLICFSGLTVTLSMPPGPIRLPMGALNFSLPVSRAGAIFDLSYNGLRYEIGGKLKDLKAKGKAHIISTSLRYPLKRTRFSSIWIGSGYEQSLLEDKLDKIVTSDRNISTGNFNFLGNFFLRED